MEPNTEHRLNNISRPAPANDPPGLCRRLPAQIECAKAAIISEFRDGLEEHANLLRLAVNEAEALAWQTDFPHLFFPGLAAEKARAVTNWHVRQRALKPGIVELALAA